MKKLAFAAVLLLLSNSVFATDIQHLKIATGAWPPFTQKDARGIYFDIANAIFKPHGIELAIEFVPYKRALKSLETERADAMFGTYSKEKENKAYLLTPSNPIDAEETAGIFKKNHRVKWQGPNSVLKHNVAWIRGFDYHEVLAFKGNVTEVDSIDQGSNMLAHDRIDLFMHPKIGLQKALNSNPKLSPYGYQMEIVLKDWLYMAFSNNTRGKTLASIYDQEFPKLLANGKIKAIFDHYRWTQHYPFKTQPSVKKLSCIRTSQTQALLHFTQSTCIR